MTRIISCTNNKTEVGEIWEASIYHPVEHRYIPIILKIIRVSNQTEYREFCREQGYPIRDEITDSFYYYEIEIMD